MSDVLDTTYRIVSLRDERKWPAAATPELAKIAGGGAPREGRLGLERTDWEDHVGRPKQIRSVLIAMEDRPGEWQLGGA